MASLNLEIITPERVVLQAEAISVTAPGIQGYLGVLPEHAPLITSLQAGVVTCHRQEGTEERLAVSGGFLEAGPDRVIILADTAERAEEIDVDRARKARERAEQRLRERPPGLDVARAEAALRRATARLKAAGAM
ncbi:MAG: F-type H+-transporting ATPase subunit epsilon [Moorella sp. (in: firmicutes)]|uniref:ATP synthase epsilon chain n=1 Tax=Neomoorella thermoacetica TaxID=1525 RepID=A0A1J5NG74_NEOTH|nr:F-type H+-transporting ATPase subunit epsilon [Moorella sp. (in: firmicutes)]OIQ57558.1 ATP synthase epsilon chain [Moorella thermoacetica]